MVKCLLSMATVILLGVCAMFNMVVYLGGYDRSLLSLSLMIANLIMLFIMGVINGYLWEKRKQER